MGRRYAARLRRGHELGKEEDVEGQAAPPQPMPVAPRTLAWASAVGNQAVQGLARRSLAREAIAEDLEEEPAEDARSMRMSRPRRIPASLPRRQPAWRHSTTFPRTTSPPERAWTRSAIGRSRSVLRPPRRPPPARPARLSWRRAS